MIRRTLLFSVLLLIAFHVAADQQPSPVIISLNPTSTVAGTGTLNVQVTGANFLNGAVVTLSGSGRNTTFVDSQHLTVEILGSDVLSARNYDVVVVDPGFLSSAPVTFQVLPNSPTITSLNPSTVTAGFGAFTLELTGHNFASTAAVNVNGQPRTTSYIDGTRLNAQIPASDVTSAHMVNITVTNPGNHISPAVVFTVTNTPPKPAITVLNPNMVQSGTGAFILSVVGTNFLSTSLVRVNGVSRTTTFVDSTHLNAQVLSSDISVPGSLSITVLNPQNQLSSPATLTVSPSGIPVLQTITPDHVIEKSGGFTLSLVGTGFVVGDTVLVGGSTRPTSFVDSTHLTATILTSDVVNSGERVVSVQAPSGGPISNTLSLFVTSADGPIITSLSPSSAATGSADTKVVINGSNFLIDDIARVNGATRTTEFISATQIAITLLAAQDLAVAGTLQITILRKDGTAVSAPAVFSVSSAAGPSITSISPNSATVGGDPFILAVNGLNFVDGAIVSIDNSPRATQFLSTTQLAVTITAADLNSARSLPVFVTNPGGQVSGVVNLVIGLSVPVITALNPSSVISGDVGFQLVITGTGFSSHSIVNVNGTARATAIQTSTGKLTTQIAASEISAPGVLAITVTENGTTSAAVNLVVLRPDIVSVTPNSLLLAGSGTPIVVRGTSFLTTSKVIFKGGERVTTYNPLDGSLTATLLPSDLADAGMFAVSVQNSPDSLSLPFLITVLSPGSPTITSLTPSSVASGSGATTLVVLGTNFTQASIVQVNGSARQTTYVSPSELHAELLASDLFSGGTLRIVVLNPDGTFSGQGTVTVNGPVIVSPRRRAAGH